MLTPHSSQASSHRYVLGVDNRGTLHESQETGNPRRPPGWRFPSRFDTILAQNYCYLT
jgi:hypothetical protein